MVLYNTMVVIIDIIWLSMEKQGHTVSHYGCDRITVWFTITTVSSSYVDI